MNKTICLSVCLSDTIPFSDEQVSAVDDLIMNMDLMHGVRSLFYIGFGELDSNSLQVCLTLCRDEDGESVEALQPKKTFNPVLQRMFQVS